MSLLTIIIPFSSQFNTIDDVKGSVQSILSKNDAVSVLIGSTEYNEELDLLKNTSFVKSIEIEQFEFKRELWFLKQQLIHSVKTEYFMFLFPGDRLTKSTLPLIENILECEQPDLVLLNREGEDPQKVLLTDYDVVNRNIVDAIYDNLNWRAHGKIFKKTKCFYSPHSKFKSEPVLFPIIQAGNVLDEAILVLGATNNSRKVVTTQVKCYSVNTFINEWGVGYREPEFSCQIIDAFMFILISFFKHEIYNSNLYKRILNTVRTDVVCIKNEIILKYMYQDLEKYQVFLDKINDKINQITFLTNLNFDVDALESDDVLIDFGVKPLGC